MNTNLTEIAHELNYAIKNYKGLTKQIVQISNRAHAYGIDPNHEELIHGRTDKNGIHKSQGLEQLKGIASRRIGNIIKNYPVWEEWLERVPGIGPAIGGELISLYYYKNIVICKDCGSDMEDFNCPICNKESKGDGVLKFRIELREFPTISSWWHFMGRHVVDGKMPKRRKMKETDEFNPNDWRNDGRTLGFQIKESFNKQSNTHKYKEFAIIRKKYRERTHPEATKGHRHNMAWNEAVKLFLSHFWQVGHILDGQPLTEPWIIKHGGHDAQSIIRPYYFNGN